MMAAWTFSLVILVVTAATVTCANETTSAGNVTRSLVVAHDVPAGFSIDRWSSPSCHDADGTEYKLLDSPHSDRFALVGNGLLMTTARLDELVHHPQPLTLYLAEDGPIRKSTHAVQLYVVDRKRLITFPKPLYRGHLKENSPAGTVVQLDGVPEVNVGGVHFDLIGGSGAFRVHRENGTSTAKLVTARPLDREQQPVYDLILRAKSSEPHPGTTSCRILVTVDDENDNRPIFTRPEFHFHIPSSGVRKYDRIGRVKALDADGDGVIYRLVTPSNLFVMIPQTGEVILAADEVPANRSFELEATARDKRGMEAGQNAKILITSATVTAEEEEALNAKVNETHNIVKRRAPRALRPTKRVEFSEADGQPEGKLMFPLDKPSEKERFKIRDDNPWVTVEPNGNVRVKRKWDYEELGPEKTIDFWVTITNSEGGGKRFLLLLFITIQRIIIFPSSIIKSSPLFWEFLTSLMIPRIRVNDANHLSSVNLTFFILFPGSKSLLLLPTRFFYFFFFFFYRALQK